MAFPGRAAGKSRRAHYFILFFRPAPLGFSMCTSIIIVGALVFAS